MAALSDAAFMQQVNQNLTIAHKVCRLYFNDAEEREDALQEMMYQLWRSYGNFDQRSKFSTWMYSVCLHTALTYRRKNTQHNNEELSADHHPFAVPPEQGEEDAVKVLFEAIHKLTLLNRAIVLLYLDDLSYEEISEITGLSRSNVSVRLGRIKNELGSELKQIYKSIEDVNL